MATDYAGKERVFIASLEADTGQPLAAWMQAISACGHSNRNDIIDWLRQNGFTFSNASWLERIHHNGGRLVYADDVPPPMSPAPPRPTARRAAAKSQPPGSSGAAPAAISPSPPPLPDHEIVADAGVSATQHPAPIRRTAPALSVVPQSPPLAPPPTALPPLDAAVTEVLAAAKGLRPLATLALQKILAAVPATVLSADGPLLIMSAPQPFLALLPGPKALRFYGNFGPGKPERIGRAEALMKVANRALPPFPSVLVLDDARLADETFVVLIEAALAEALKSAATEPALQAPAAIQGAAHT